MRKRTRYTLLVVGLALAALAVAVFLRQKAPPEAARLLPESDAIVYLNLKPIRAATHFDRTPVERSAEFRQFIDATGIVPERDLDEAAFALHRMPDPKGPNGPVAFSEVFQGRFDGTRLARYLGGLAAPPGGGVETYANHTIYTIPIEGRRFRIVQLAYDTVAASNMPTTEQIHGIIDLQRASASPFSGSSLLAARYREVPVLSSAWAVGRVGLPFASDDGRITVFGLELPFTVDTDFVASIRLTTALHLRVEEIAPSPAEAERSASKLTTMVGFLKSLEHTHDWTQAGMAQKGSPLAAIEAMKIERQNDRVVLTTTISVSALQALFKQDRP